MQESEFLKLIELIELLSPEQLALLHQTIPPIPSNPASSNLMKRIEYYFDKSPFCPHCSCDSLTRWGQSDGHQRYRCNKCHKTCNAFTKTPLTHCRVQEQLDSYLSCMDGKTSLREAAKHCEISLPTSFRLRHCLMEVICDDSTGLLSGISEMDETFFAESFKGQRTLGDKARKRGKRKHKVKSASVKAEVKVKQIPVMVACDRDNHIIDAVLNSMKNKEIFSSLQGRIQEGSTLCTDSYASHHQLEEQLHVTLKELNASKGEYVKEERYHIQTVNSYHNALKCWINGFFKGVATKYLDKYLGWKRFLKTHLFSVESFLEQEAMHWIHTNST